MTKVHERLSRLMLGERHDRIYGAGRAGELKMAEDVRALFEAATTPARAEAQDEGAAGSDAVSHHAKTDADPVVSMLRDVAERLERPEPDLLGARVGVQAVRLAVSSRLLTHPSPTPAADADRVRIAVEAFNAKINAPLTGPTHGAWQDISTAPKDGTIILTYGSLHNDGAPYGIGETPSVKISQYSQEGEFWCCDAWGSHEPVWWMPLPAAPTGDAK